MTPHTVPFYIRIPLSLNNNLPPADLVSDSNTRPLPLLNPFSTHSLFGVLVQTKKPNLGFWRRQEIWALVTGDPGEVLE